MRRESAYVGQSERRLEQKRFARGQVGEDDERAKRRETATANTRKRNLSVRGMFDPIFAGLGADGIELLREFDL